MRIALIGGKGGVGTSLVTAWRDEHELTVLDRRTDPMDGVRDIVAEADDPDALAEALDGADAVVHLAALLPRGPEEDQLRLTARAIGMNVGAVLLALRMSRVQRARSFVHISSLSVFGGYGAAPLASGTRPDATALYGFSKRIAEDALREAVMGEAPTAAEGPITVTSLRLAFPTTAADWPLWRSPMPDLQPEPIMQRMDDGTPICSLHPEDLVSAVGAAIGREQGGPYEAMAITAAGQTIQDDAAQRLLGWRPRHVL